MTEIGKILITRVPSPVASFIDSKRESARMILSTEQSQSLHSSIAIQTETVIARLMQLDLPDLCELDSSKAIGQICARKNLCKLKNYADKSMQDV